MSQLQYDPLEFLEFFGVMPETDEYDPIAIYVISSREITLTCAVCDWNSTVSLSLQREGAEKPLISFALFVGGEVRRRQEKWGDYLEFKHCLLCPYPFWAVTEHEELAMRQFAQRVNFELYLRPDIRITIE